jgi:hypothetical protein
MEEIIELSECYFESDDLKESLNIEKAQSVEMYKEGGGKHSIQGS